MQERQNCSHKTTHCYRKINFCFYVQKKALFGFLYDVFASYFQAKCKNRIVKNEQRIVFPEWRYLNWLFGIRYTIFGTKATFYWSKFFQFLKRYLFPFDCRWMEQTRQWYMQFSNSLSFERSHVNNNCSFTNFTGLTCLPWLRFALLNCISTSFAKVSWRPSTKFLTGILKWSSTIFYTTKLSISESKPVKSKKCWFQSRDES